jgi:hypothetical protein
MKEIDYSCLVQRCRSLATIHHELLRATYVLMTFCGLWPRCQRLRGSCSTPQFLVTSAPLMSGRRLRKRSTISTSYGSATNPHPFLRTWGRALLNHGRPANFYFPLIDDRLPGPIRMVPALIG